MRFWRATKYLSLQFAHGPARLAAFHLVETSRLRLVHAHEHAIVGPGQPRLKEPFLKRRQYTHRRVGGTWLEFMRTRFATHRVANLRRAVAVSEIELPDQPEIGDREASAEVHSEVRGKFLDQPLSVASPLPAPLFLFDDLPSDVLVGREHRRIHGPQSPMARLSQNFLDPRQTWRGGKITAHEPSPLTVCLPAHWELPGAVTPRSVRGHPGIPAG
jgi:hypothetical protein